MLLSNPKYKQTESLANMRKTQRSAKQNIPNSKAARSPRFLFYHLLKFNVHKRIVTH